MRTDDEPPEAFDVSFLVGRTVLSVISDPASGSLFEIGEWIRMRRPIENPNIPSQSQNYKGSESVLILRAWQFEVPSEMKHLDSGDSGVQAQMDLFQIVVGSKITRAVVQESTLNLVIVFDNGAVLNVIGRAEGVDDLSYTVRIDGVVSAVYTTGITSRDEVPHT